MHIRRLIDGDEIQVVKILEEAFNDWPPFDLEVTPLDHWYWKYRPNMQQNRSIVAELNGEIIGCFHVVNIRVKHVDREILMDVGFDTAIKKEYRGLGIYSKMLEERVKSSWSDCEVSYWSSNNPIVINKQIKKRTNLPTQIKYYVKIEDVNLHTRMVPTKNAMLKRIGYTSLRTLNEIKSRVSEKKSLDPTIDVNEIKGFSEEFNRFWNETKDEYSFIIKRDKQFLNWRYCDLRGGKYSVFQAVKNDELLGYIVLRINKINPDYPQGYIIDLMTRTECPKAMESLLEYAVDYFSNNQINIVHFIFPEDTQKTHLLNKYGFLDRRSNFVVFFNSKDNSYDVDGFITAAASRKVHFSFGDLDFI